MTVMVGKLTSIGGEPFGGEGHAVNIFSRVTRTSPEDEAVILQLIDRIEMPSVEDGGDGTFTTADMDPGPIRVELEGSSRHGEGWDINLPEPDPEDPRPWSLGSLIGLQVDWDPVVVGRAESAAREAARQAVAAEGHAGVAAEHRAHIDEVVYDVMTNAAGMVRDEVKDDADRAEAQAGVATEQAGLAGEHRQKAEDAEDSAHAAAGAAAEATKTEIRAEMDSKVSEAEQSAQSSGESAAASATSAGESATSAQEAGESAQAASEHLQDTRDLKGGIDSWFQDDLLPKVDQVAADAAATKDDRRQTGEDRTATGGHLTEVTRLHEETETAKTAAEQAAENAQTGAPPGGWVKGDLDQEVRNSLSRADSALQSIPVATPDAPGSIQLAGDLEGTAQAPRVVGKVNSADVSAAGAAPGEAAGKIPRISEDGVLAANLEPRADNDAVAYSTLQEGIETAVGHTDEKLRVLRLPSGRIDGLDALIDQRAAALIEANGPRIERVTALPDTPDPDTLYYVVEGS